MRALGAGIWICVWCSVILGGVSFAMLKQVLKFHSMNLLEISYIRTGCGDEGRLPS